MPISQETAFIEIKKSSIFETDFIYSVEEQDQNKVVDR